jgi:hypothetical protein
MAETKEEAAAVERLWQAARFLPQTVRLLGTRYRSMFLAHAQRCALSGDQPAVADALAFIDFMQSQNRVGLLPPERRALDVDGRRLRRRYRLRREGAVISAVEKWKILQWLSF